MVFIILISLMYTTTLKISGKHVLTNNSADCVMYYQRGHDLGPKLCRSWEKASAKYRSSEPKQHCTLGQHKAKSQNIKSFSFILKVPALASKCRLWHENKANQSISGEKLPHFDINNIFVAQKLRKLGSIW